MILSWEIGIKLCQKIANLMRKEDCRFSLHMKQDYNEKSDVVPVLSIFINITIIIII